jgi:hypothetical protein
MVFVNRKTVCFAHSFIAAVDENRNAFAVGANVYNSEVGAVVL